MKTLLASSLTVLALAFSGVGLATPPPTATMNTCTQLIKQFDTNVGSHAAAARGW